MTPTFINFKPLGDHRGSLVAVEAESSVPFPIRRVYYIYGTKDGVERGFHAHKELKQVAVAVSGSCEIVLENGDSSVSVILDSRTKGVLISPMVWHYMKNFSDDCVLLVLADGHYEESDYIRDYGEFTRQFSK